MVLPSNMIVQPFISRNKPLLYYTCASNTKLSKALSSTSLHSLTQYISGKIDGLPEMPFLSFYLYFILLPSAPSCCLESTGCSEVQHLMHAFSHLRLSSVLYRNGQKRIIPSMQMVLDMLYPLTSQILFYQTF